MLVSPIDPYFNDVPWEIIYDKNGRVLAEIFVVPHYLSSKKLTNRSGKKMNSGGSNGAKHIRRFK